MLVAVMACCLQKMVVAAIVLRVSKQFTDMLVSSLLAEDVPTLPTWQLQYRTIEFCDLGHPSSYYYISWI
jgi:hypothetical protein